MTELRLLCPKCHRKSLVAVNMMYDAGEMMMTIIFTCCTYYESEKKSCPVVMRFEGRGFREDRDEDTPSQTYPDRV